MSDMRWWQKVFHNLFFFKLLHFKFPKSKDFDFVARKHGRRYTNETLGEEYTKKKSSGNFLVTLMLDKNDPRKKTKMFNFKTVMCSDGL